MGSLGVSREDTRQRILNNDLRMANKGNYWVP